MPAKKAAAASAPKAPSSKRFVAQVATPSQLALAEVGIPPAKASKEELNEHAARYRAAYAKARWNE